MNRRSAFVKKEKNTHKKKQRMKYIVVFTNTLRKSAQFPYIVQTWKKRNKCFENENLMQKLLLGNIHYKFDNKGVKGFNWCSFYVKKWSTYISGLFFSVEYQIRVEKQNSALNLGSWIECT